MSTDLSRAIRILSRQIRYSSFTDLFLLGIRALFKIEKIIIYVRELESANSFKLNGELDDQIHKAEISEIEEARKRMVSPSWEFCCHLYDHVRDCFIFKDSEVGHVSWIYYQNDPNRLIRLGAYEAEIKYSLTRQEYRGKGLYPATLIKIQGYLLQKGYKRVFICVHEDNFPSIRGIEKAGFKLVNKMKLIKCIGIQFSGKFSSNISQEHSHRRHYNIFRKET